MSISFREGPSVVNKVTESDHLIKEPLLHL